MSEGMVWLIVYLPAFGLIPAYFARRKGRNFVLWWIYGTVLLPLAAAHLIFITVTEGTRRCMFCGGSVKRSASYCGHCGHEFIQF